jgi:hypothetical protein
VTGAVHPVSLADERLVTAEITRMPVPVGSGS